MFSIEWDKETNGVTLVSAPTEASLASAPRPVFAAELDMLGMRGRGWEYPQTAEPLCWTINRKYYSGGVCVMDARGGDMYEEPVVHVTPGYESLKLYPIDIKQVIDKNSAFLNFLEYEALSFIIENYRRVSGAPVDSETGIDWMKLKELQEEYSNTDMAVVQRACGSLDIMPLEAASKGNIPIIRGGKVDSVVVSFSGGKDSQVVLDLVTRVIAPDKYSVAYSDTGYELPSSLQLYTETEDYYRSRFPDIKFHLIKNHQPVMYYWDNMGAPSRMHRWCCAVMKTAPLYRYIKEQSGLGKQPRVLVFEGVRAEESARRAGYLRVGKAVKHQGVTNARPIFKWNSTEVYLYILRHHLPFNVAYEQGLSRVGCALCPFSTPWSEHVVMKNYPQTMQPFVDHLEQSSKEIGVGDIRDYIRHGNWKTRGGGRTILNRNSFSEVEVVDAGTDFTVILTNPKEDFLEWLKIVGRRVFFRSGESNDGDGYVEWKTKGTSITQSFKVEHIDASRVKIIFPYLTSNPILRSLLLKVINKATYCVHCEACEVECPSGALRVTPQVSIDAAKCFHCLRCLTFKDKGCMVANSLTISYNHQARSRANKKMNLDRYNTFGLEKEWLRSYLKDVDGFFLAEHIELNPQKQIPALRNWLRDAFLLSPNDLKPTPLAIFAAKENLFERDDETLWQILWANLTSGSPICAEYVQTVRVGQSVSKKELISAISGHVPSASERTVKNAVDSLVNLITKSPLENDMFDVTRKGHAVTSITRKPTDVTHAALVYSIFSYAERHEKNEFTVSELIDPASPDSLATVFGMTADTLGPGLRALQNIYHLIDIQIQARTGSHLKFRLTEQDAPVAVLARIRDAWSRTH